MEEDVKAKWFLIAYYDGIDNKCFDETRYDFQDFSSAYEYYKTYNESIQKGLNLDYVKLHAYINDDIGFVLIGDFNPL